MCGIAGLVSRHSIQDRDIDLIRRMNQIQKHRGPDDEGIYYDQTCVLGHRRLAIIDLSKDGHQPFMSDDKRYQLVYNGEIYNYIELRDELKQCGWDFRTKTDTEVLLKAYQQYGKECLSKFNGMFAFAIYDTQQQSLFLARDRVGIKPLYYILEDSTLYFASEIKAFFALPSLKTSINDQSLFDYLVFNRTDIFDETFIEQIKRLPKGHFGVFEDGQLKIEQWWDPEKYLNKRHEDSLERIAQTIEELLISAAQLRLRSDVTVGSCLSGGLDSSILLGILYSTHSIQNGYQTFTASFPGSKLDEIKYIDLFNQRFPFRNFRTFPKEQDARAQLRDFIYTNDEPTTGATFYSQYSVMKLAKENDVTVLLDGQGGDENFAGYHYFHGFYLYGLWRQQHYGFFIRDLLRTIFRQQDISSYQTLLFQMLPDQQRRKLLYRTVPYINKDFFDKHIGTSKIYKDFFNVDGLNVSILRHFQYKLEHLLRTEDRNSMAFSIEARVPYLDYRLIEYLLGIAEQYKIKAGETKYLQKLSVGKYSIPDIVNRKDKLGFATPMDQWMNAPRWQQMTEENFQTAKRLWPQVFNESRMMPQQGDARWKINQLSVWQDIFKK